MEPWYEPRQSGFRICAWHILPFKFHNPEIKEEKEATYFGFGGKFPLKSRGIKCSLQHHCKDWEIAASFGSSESFEPVWSKTLVPLKAGYLLCRADASRDLWAGQRSGSTSSDRSPAFELSSTLGKIQRVQPYLCLEFF